MRVDTACPRVAVSRIIAASGDVFYGFQNLYAPLTVSLKSYIGDTSVLALPGMASSATCSDRRLSFSLHPLPDLLTMRLQIRLQIRDGYKCVGKSSGSIRCREVAVADEKLAPASLGALFLLSPNCRQPVNDATSSVHVNPWARAEGVVWRFVPATPIGPLS
jgi:hypothetical protein